MYNKLSSNSHNSLIKKKDITSPTREDAESAIRILLKWIGDDPLRDGLISTPSRVISYYEKFFIGYRTIPSDIFIDPIYNIDKYNEMIILKNINFKSYCEHHIVPIIGRAHIAYWPDSQIVGISKLVRLVDIIAKRLQLQERMTAQISHVLDNALNPKGVGVIIESSHECIAINEVHKSEIKMITSSMLGVFNKNQLIRKEFLSQIYGSIDLGIKNI